MMFTQTKNGEILLNNFCKAVLKRTALLFLSLLSDKNYNETDNSNILRDYTEVAPPEL